MRFEDFIGPGSMISPLGAVEDVEGRELCDVAGPSAQDIGWMVATLPEAGVSLHAYEGDRMISLAAIAPDGRTVGCYEGLSLWVEPAWRSRGIGTELVIQAARRRGGTPVDDETAVAFSPDGWAAHRRAYTRLYPDTA